MAGRPRAAPSGAPSVHYATRAPGPVAANPHTVRRGEPRLEVEPCPSTLLRSKRAVAVAVVATLVGVSAAVLLSGQSTTAQAAAAPGSTVRASVGNGTTAQAPRGGANQELSADGTAVAFTSCAQLDDPADGRYESVYVRDLRNNRTVMISRGQFTRVDPGPDIGRPRLAGEPMLSLNGRRRSWSTARRRRRGAATRRRSPRTGATSRS